MKNLRLLSFTLFLLTAYCLPLTAQIPQATMLRIVRAEDELRFEKDLQDLLKSPDTSTRKRAALAAGRIGNEKAVLFLADLLEKDANADVRAMAAFAIGEVESKLGADAVLKALAKKDETDAVRARAVEAAGKIAAAIAASDKEKSADLGEAILDALEAEFLKTNRNKEIVLLGLTAALRAKAEETDVVVAKFLSDKDARVRADVLNTLVRLRAKSDDLKGRYRAMLLSDDDAIVRANAARALGASEDTNALDLLIEAATNDTDQRVRVAAIRSLATLKNKKAAEPLLTYGEKLLTAYKTAKTKNANPAEKNELLEIATTSGGLLQNSNGEKAIKFIKDFRHADGYVSPEIEIAFAKISPTSYLALENEPSSNSKLKPSWQVSSGYAQGIGEYGSLPLDQRELREPALANIGILIGSQESHPEEIIKAVPDLLRAFATFKAEYYIPEYASVLRESNADFLSRILRGYVTYKEKTPPEPFRAVPRDNKTFGYNDVVVRATAAELLGKQPISKENVEALKTAFAQSLEKDIDSNDAMLAVLSALVKLDKNEAKGSLQSALNHTDFLVRRQAATLIRQNGLEKDFPKADEQVGTVRLAQTGKTSKLGVILNKEADYIRAISRKNGQTKAVLTTEKGVFTIDLLPEDAPLTVDNFVQLAKKNYFNGIAFHRVVPNFVVQGGDPRGDGNGGPGWQIRCEINMVEYERGAVGMALSGKDTGGSQWFVTHSPQPHLDGGYTVFGKVNEIDLKIVDSIARGDKILSVKIIENISRKGAKTQRKTK